MNPWWLSPAAASGRLVLRALWATYRLELDPDSAERLASAPHPTILVAWHDQTAALGAWIFGLLQRGERAISIMVSPSQDGELVTRAAVPLGFRVVRGSASRGGRQALLGIYRETSRQTSSPLILPDGPRGPAHVVKAGAIVLAQITGAPLLPLAAKPQRSVAIGSWDRMAIPLPFTRVRLRVGEPMVVPPQLSTDEREQLCAALGDKMEKNRVALAS